MIRIGQVIEQPEQENSKFNTEHYFGYEKELIETFQVVPIMGYFLTDQQLADFEYECKEELWEELDLDIWFDKKHHLIKPQSKP